MSFNIAGPVIARIHRDVQALFSRINEVDETIPKPRITLDLPGAKPEPLHVFTWGTAREFDVAGALTGNVLQMTFHVWLTVWATASQPEEAMRIASAYQSLALQIPLVDKTLGGTVEEIGLPQVREADAWADADGKRHAGYLLDFEVAVTVFESPTAARIIEEMNDE